MSLKGITVEEQIWNFLKNSGFNDFGIAGLMGNLYAESGLRSNNMQGSYEKKLGMTDQLYTQSVDNGTYTNFAKDSVGYGLAQWTYWSRKEKLYQYSQTTKRSIGDLEMQLEFLVKELKEAGDFCIGGACYPEIHPESADQKEDIRHLKEKVDAGCEFLTTQMFFDNNLLYNFLYKIREAGITVPIVPGIMPITNANQVERAIKLSGSFMPQRFKSLVDKFGDDPAAMKQAGIAYATDQIIDLFANNVTNVHVYSMNKPDVAEKIQNNLSDILGK